ncbi:MAG: PASTA domain-containing protein [Bacilli bacterium]|nr:PASTA domain-containing protein [Bacilli bacterium]
MNVIKKRIIFMIILITSMIMIIIGRLAYIKIFAQEDYFLRALELWTRDAPIEGRRGNIYDRNGKLIVGSQLAPTIVVIPNQVKEKERTANILSNILKCQKEDILNYVKKNTSVEIIKKHGQKIEPALASKVIEANLEGVYVVADSKRYYPYGHYLSQVLGIVGIDNQGITGLEYYYNDYLKGEKGALEILTDAHGEMFENINSNYESPTSGCELYLTIDLEIQIALERVLDNAVVQYSPDEMMGLIMKPGTSEVLAMASRPTFNPQNYQDYDQSLYNRNLPIWKSFEPGSTFKIVTFAAGLEENVFRLDETYNDPGFMIVDGARIKDWKAGGHGTETFREVLQNSCNPGFMTIGFRLGKVRLFNYIEKFGFGKKTNIDLLGESSGIVFNLDKVGNVELATSSFGQGNSVTAIQLVNAACAAVNGGILNRPTILKGISTLDSKSIIEQTLPIEVRRVISESTSKKVAESLEYVAALGTARSAYIEGYRVGGKTGTAQVAKDGIYQNGKYILSFLGIAPMNDPQVAAYIAVENAKNAIQYGGVVVAPMIKEVLMSSFSALNIEKQSDGLELDARYWIDKRSFIVDDYVGMSVSDVKRKTQYINMYKVEIIGSGNMIIAQLPYANQKIVEEGVVILFTN